MRLVDTQTRYVNRSVLIVRPREPFLRWIAATEPGVAQALLALVRSRRTAYLVPLIEMEVTPEAVLEQCWREVFEQELCGYSRDEDLWPRNRTRQMFERWFEVEIAETVVDLDRRRLRVD